MNKQMSAWKILVGLVALVLMEAATADRIKDLASVAGVRDNQLLGYGLVVGLDGTGDQTTQTPYTTQSLKSMLSQYGITVPDGVTLSPKNVAAVAVHADLPAFAKPGQRIDVTVSSLGNADSLRGGTLLMTPLRGVDKRIYAIAQGDLVVSGFGVSGDDGSRIVVNVPSAGRIPNGATVERSVKSPFDQGEHVYLNLNDADFTTAKRLAKAINEQLGPNVAQPEDAGTIKVSAPVSKGQRVSFISYLENLQVDPGEAPAKVIINSRSGTVVINRKVRVSPAAVSHGNLMVSIKEDPQVSQPEPFSEGETTVTPDTAITAEQEKSRMFKFAPGVSLDEIVEAVNRVGAAPGDMVAILEALKEAGALRAELVVI